MAEAGDNEGRDAHGRFTAGNPGGPGGRRSHAVQLRRAVEEAVSVDHAVALVRRILRMGLEGDIAAARLVFERTCGRAAEAPTAAEPIDIALPRLRSAEDCGIALERLIDGVCTGKLDKATAQTLIAGVQARLKAIETTELERRVAELEQAAAAATSTSIHPLRPSAS